MAKFYVAATYKNRAEAFDASRQIEAANPGWTCTSRWLQMEEEPNADFSDRWQTATHDLEDVDAGSVIVVLSDGQSSGKWIETGYAYANGKKVIIVGEYNNPVFGTLFEHVATVGEVVL